MTKAASTPEADGGSEQERGTGDGEVHGAWPEWRWVTRRGGTDRKEPALMLQFHRGLNGLVQLADGL